MTVIPGAEFAPILTRTVIDLGPEGSEYQLEREIRWRADVTDPDDMRAIWRRAALALGATEEEAMAAVLLHDGWSWCLVTFKPASHGDGYEATVRDSWRDENGCRNMAHATATLCAHVWGPK